MVFGVLEPVERLPECEVADHIEGSQVVPLHHVGLLSGLGDVFYFSIKRSI